MRVRLHATVPVRDMVMGVKYYHLHPRLRVLVLGFLDSAVEACFDEGRDKWFDSSISDVLNCAWRLFSPSRHTVQHVIVAAAVRVSPADHSSSRDIFPKQGVD